MKDKAALKKSLDLCKNRIPRLIIAKAPDIIIARECWLFLKRYGKIYGSFRIYRFVSDLKFNIMFFLHKNKIYKFKAFEDI